MKSNSPTRGEREHAGFTLIELLVVIAIIVILAGLLLQTAGFVQEKAGRTRAETEIKALETGIDTYKLDNGTYPEQADAGPNSTKVLIQYLAVDIIDNPAQSGNRKPFEFPIKMLGDYQPGSGASYDVVLRGSDNLIDPFGNPYHYQFPGDPKRSGEQSFDLFSKGRKNEGGDDATDPAITTKWIKNW